MGSSPTSSTSSGPGAIVPAHEFRNRLGWHLERAAAGESFAVTRRGRPYVRVGPAAEPLFAEGEAA